MCHLIRVCTVCQDENNLQGQKCNTILKFQPNVLQTMHSMRGSRNFSRGVGGGGGGVQLFPGGSNYLFPIETHITCDFPGGSKPLYCIKPGAHVSYLTN